MVCTTYAGTVTPEFGHGPARGTSWPVARGQADGISLIDKPVATFSDVCDLSALWIEIQDKWTRYAQKESQREDYVFLDAPVVVEDETQVDVSALEKQFKERADLWEKEVAVFSDPASMYLNKNYMVIIAKGIENPKVIVPLILDRVAKKGGDWFFALEKISDHNPAENSTSYDGAISAWRDWATKNF